MAKRLRSARFTPAKLRIGPGFAEAMTLLRNDGVLRLEYDKGVPAWSLGSGQPVSPEIVSLILASGGVEATDDALIPGTPCQTWRLRR
jgi:hypothetical protein